MTLMLFRARDMSSRCLSLEALMCFLSGSSPSRGGHMLNKTKVLKWTQASYSIRVWPLTVLLMRAVPIFSSVLGRMWSGNTVLSELAERFDISNSLVRGV